MNQLTKLFDGHELTIIQNGDNPKFLLKDVCEILGLSNPRMVKERLGDDVSSTYPIQDRLGRTQQATFVNEDGLYDVILDSRKPEAKKFRKWITSEVLPTIRKTGGYVQEDRADDFVNTWLPQLDETSRMAIASALESNRRLLTENKELVTTIKEQRPKVVFAESCLVSQDSVLVKEVAKLACNQGLKIGQNRLYNKLRDWGYIQKKDTQPTQRAIESGYFEILQRSIQTPEGSKLTRTTKVTTKGQMQIINRLKAEKEEGVFS